MKYAKPEVLASTSALEVIATVQLEKGPFSFPDRDMNNPTPTAGAYEADE